jgi:hypothetical protein
MTEQMPEDPGNSDSITIPTLDSVLEPFAQRVIEVAGGSEPPEWGPQFFEDLEAALLAREDAMRDALNLGGVQFGLYPFIVSEVLTTVGLGTPPSEEARAMIRTNFINGMEDLRRQFGG